MSLFTLALACIVLELCCAAGLFIMSQAGSGLSGLRWFTFAYVCNAAAIAAGLIHPRLEPSGYMNGSRLLFLASALLLTQGAAEFVSAEAETLVWGLWMLAAVMTAEVMLAWVGPAGGHLTGIGLFALAYAAQSVVTISLLWTNRAEGEQAACQVTALLVSGVAVLSLIRGVLTQLGWAPPDLLYASPLRAIMVPVYLVLTFGMAFGFVWMAIARQRQLLARQASTDALTGALNRRALDAAADGLAAGCRARGAALAVVAIDLDRFKLLNDSFGHAGGDAVLIAVARLLRRNLRPTDVVARFGGEEFIALLPERDAASALMIAERLRRRVADMTVEFEGSRLAVTASFGVAHAEVSAAGRLEWRELLRRADHLLYEAKEAGRNCIRSEAAAPPAAGVSAAPVPA